MSQLPYSGSEEDDDQYWERYWSKTWSAIIHHNKYTHDADDMCFTALKTLRLDFGQWELDAEELAQPQRILSVSNFFFRGPLRGTACKCSSRTNRSVTYSFWDNHKVSSLCLEILN